MEKPAAGSSGLDCHCLLPPCLLFLTAGKMSGLVELCACDGFPLCVCALQIYANPATLDAALCRCTRPENLQTIFDGQLCQ